MTSFQSYTELKDERERIRKERKEVEKALTLRIATNTEFSAIQSRSLMTARRILLQQIDEAQQRREDFKNQVNKVKNQINHIKYESNTAVTLRREQVSIRIPYFCIICRPTSSEVTTVLIHYYRLS